MANNYWIGNHLTPMTEEMDEAHKQQLSSQITLLHQQGDALTRNLMGQNHGSGQCYSFDGEEHQNGWYESNHDYYDTPYPNHWPNQRDYDSIPPQYYQTGEMNQQNMLFELEDSSEFGNQYSYYRPTQETYSIDDLNQKILQIAQEADAFKEESRQRQERIGQNIRALPTFKEPACSDYEEATASHPPMDHIAYVYEDEPDFEEPPVEEGAAQTTTPYPEIVETLPDPTENIDPRVLAVWNALPSFVNHELVEARGNAPSCIVVAGRDEEETSLVEGDDPKPEMTIDDELPPEPLPLQVSEQVNIPCVLESTESYVENLKPISFPLCDLFLISNPNVVSVSFCSFCFCVDCVCESPQKKRRIRGDFVSVLQDGEERDPWLPHSYDLSYSLRPP